jgi:hypothetical protein
MSEEDQERLEDYLELECYIEKLQAGDVAHPPATLTFKQARIYRMALLFRAASPQGAQPRPDLSQRCGLASSRGSSSRQSHNASHSYARRYQRILPMSHDVDCLLVGSLLWPRWELELVSSGSPNR